MHHPRVIITVLGALVTLSGSAIQAEESVNFPAGRPNILFAIADDASFPHMGAYGCKWVETPAFDRVARQGVLFTRAYTPNAKCAPSRSSILTGRNSWQLEAAANHWCDFPSKFKVYTEALAGYGYRVGMTGKGWGPGYALDAEGKPRQMAGKPFQQLKMNPPAKAMSGIDYAGNFARFLEDADPSEPWAFWYGGYEPHRAYEFGAGINKGKKKLSDIDEVPGIWPDTETVRTDMLDYAYEIEYFDLHLQRMLDELESKGMLDNTIVVVTADNGMPFPRVKGQEYEMSNHLPLAIMWGKGISRPGRTCHELVSFIDFAPTFMDAAGLTWEQTGMAPSPGRSLIPLLTSRSDESESALRSHVLIGKERHDIGRPHDWGYPIRGIVQGDLLYLRNFEPDRWPAGNPETGYLNCDGSPTKTTLIAGRTTAATEGFWQAAFGKRQSEELFNVKEDPYCLKNLADQPMYLEAKRQLREKLIAELTIQKDPRIVGDGAIFDEYPYAGQAHRGFYERFMQGENLTAGWVNPSDFEKQPIGEVKKKE
jgi:N-sulfoglucosamine sulfohydrolase